jgi:hypothetical protein
MRRHAIVVVLALLCACAGGDDKQSKSAHSWKATALVVTGDWLRGEVPSAYAQEALKKAADKLEEGPLRDSAGRVTQLRSAIDQGEPARVRKLLGELR